ncbi:MAG: hypothetical protein DELT_00402 [Desulfovibrio sp.]
MKTTHPLRPAAVLNEITRQNPSAWKTVEAVYLAKGKGDVPDWPAWCFIPLFPWRYIAAQWAKLPDEKVTREILMLLASVGTWRYSQGVYRFSPELYDALSKTDLNSKIPADVLLRLPEWSVYVEIPGLPWGADNTLWGFWAFLDWEVVTNTTTLHITCDLDRGFEARSLELGDFSLAESLIRMIEPAVKHKPGAVVRWEAYKGYILPELIERYSLLVSLLLYICSDDPEFNGPESGVSPKRPQLTKVKTGIRLFPANGPRVWHTGLEIGERLERERVAAELSAKERKGVKPHLRRAHWHGYWTGPRKKDDGENNTMERKFSHRWLPPIFVSTPENADPEE